MKYSIEIIDKICAELAIGKSMTTIGKMDGFPCSETIYTWLTKHPEFVEKYDRAKEQQMELFANQIIELSDSCTADNDHVQKTKLQIHTRQWVMGKLKPKKYGDNMTVKGDKDNPLILNLAGALDQAIAQRLSALRTVDHMPNTALLPPIEVNDSVPSDDEWVSKPSPYETQGRFHWVYLS